jgi:hypothetical protein
MNNVKTITQNSTISREFEKVLEGIDSTLYCETKMAYINDNMLDVSIFINKKGASCITERTNEYFPYFVSLNNYPEYFTVGCEMIDESKVSKLELKDTDSISKFINEVVVPSKMFKRVCNYNISDNYMDSFF